MNLRQRAREFLEHVESGQGYSGQLAIEFARLVLRDPALVPDRHERARSVLEGGPFAISRAVTLAGLILRDPGPSGGGIPSSEAA